MFKFINTSNFQKKVQVGKDQEKAQSEKPKPRWAKS